VQLDQESPDGLEPVELYGVLAAKAALAIMIAEFDARVARHRAINAQIKSDKQRRATNAKTHVGLLALFSKDMKRLRDCGVAYDVLEAMINERTGVEFSVSSVKKTIRSVEGGSLFFPILG
jgi:hypothetical protein